MTERDEPRDAQRLSAETARSLLSRASELEAARGSELSVAELREAAREAGIAPAAFDQALTELRERDSLTASSPPKPSGLSRMLRFWPAALIVVAFLTFLLLRMIVPAS